MAAIIPFQGILYNPEKIQDLSLVLTPPYDVINPEEQEAFHQKHPNSVIRLILGKAAPKDDEGENPHTRAAAYFRQWQNDKALATDPTPCFYLMATDFDSDGKTHTRLGLMARVRLEPFSTGAVKPHEQTFSKVKSERLSLFKKCHANFSPIFSLFRDPDGSIFGKMNSVVQEQTPDVDVVDHAGHRQRMWRIADPEVQAFLSDRMAQRSVYIADGHHRYETGLNYLEWVKSQNSGLPEDHPARYIMMYLSSMADPGLIILPAHRMLSRLTPEARQSFLDKMPDYFDIQEFSGDGEEVREGFLSALQAPSERVSMGLVLPGQPLRLLHLKPGAMESLFAAELAPELRDLDVTVLRSLIFLKLLGLSEQDMDDASLISYTTKHRQVIGDVQSGKAAAGFLLNATKIEHVRAVAKAGLIMPRKSTYFYPKVITGMVLNSLQAPE